MSFDSPYYAATVLCVATAAALLTSAVAGHRHSSPVAGVPVVIVGLLVGLGPAFYGTLVGAGPNAGLDDVMLAGLAGFGIGVLVGLAAVVPLTLHWSRNSEK